VVLLFPAGVAGVVVVSLDCASGAFVASVRGVDGVRV
jgi:hypothetical protein